MLTSANSWENQFNISKWKLDNKLEVNSEKFCTVQTEEIQAMEGLVQKGVENRLVKFG